MANTNYNINSLNNTLILVDSHLIMQETFTYTVSEMQDMLNAKFAAAVNVSDHDITVT